MKRLKEKKDRIKLLIEKGATFSTSGLFIHTGNMVITADELTTAQKQHLDSVEQKKSDIIDKKTAAMLEVKINAESGARKAKSIGTEKLLLKDWKCILKYILYITDDIATLSSFNSKALIRAKLEDLKWEQYFIETETTVVDIPITTLCPDNNPTDNPNEDDNIVLTNDIETVKI